MGWNRIQHNKPEYKRPRHARIPLCVERCSDCGKVLQVTYAVTRFLGRCRSCFDLHVQAVVISQPAFAGEMASHEDAYGGL